MKSAKATLTFHLLNSVSFLATSAALASELTTTTSITSLPLFTAINSGEKPAVDGVNGKLQFYGGASQDNSVNIANIPGLAPISNANTVWRGIGGATGTISIPLTHAFGAQFDLGSGAFGNRPVGDASGHLFWRDPDKGLIGAYGSGLLSEGKIGYGVWTAAGEFESYLGRFTAKALLGVQGSSAYTGNLTRRQFREYGGPASFSQPNYFTDIVSATFYPIDDLALSAGHIYSFGRNAITGEAEYLLPQFRGSNIAPSAFVTAAYGWSNSSFIMAGIRIYFGNHDKTLIRRQREDDPQVHSQKQRYIRPAFQVLNSKYSSDKRNIRQNICSPGTCNVVTSKGGQAD